MTKLSGSLSEDNDSDTELPEIERDNKGDHDNYIAVVDTKSQDSGQKD